MEIEEFGNELTIVGFVVGNGNKEIFVSLPEREIKQETTMDALYPTPEELLDIFKQLDTAQITNSEKIVLRKSQRQLDANINWQVFRRDNYTCRYCGANDKPLTVDHIVLWSEGGQSVPDNLITSCAKCNHTRGKMPYNDWLSSAYYKKICTDSVLLQANEIAGVEALELPLIKLRSR